MKEPDDTDIDWGVVGYFARTKKDKAAVDAKQKRRATQTKRLRTVDKNKGRAYREWESSKQLERAREAYRVGNVVALQDALVLCAAIGTAAEWVITGAYEELDAVFTRRRTAPVKQFKWAMVHYLRYAWVWELADETGNWDAAYKEASRLLTRKPEKGSPATMQSSFRKVFNDLQDERRRHCYYMPKYIRPPLF